jgi:hypothetical protein
MSFGASGALAKAVVYFPWKGIDAVRSYVVPANPKTAAQITQRDIMKAAVAEWHGALYSAGDVTAWNRFAGIIGGIMTGFNAMVKTYVVEKLLGNVWARINHGSTSDVLTTSFVAIVHKAAGGNAPSVHYGTSKTNMPNTVVLASGGGDTWQNLVAGLTKDTLYYFYFHVGTSKTDYGRTGIYAQRTLAA